MTFGVLEMDGKSAAIRVDADLQTASEAVTLLADLTVKRLMDIVRPAMSAAPMHWRGRILRWYLRLIVLNFGKLIKFDVRKQVIGYAGMTPTYAWVASWRSNWLGVASKHVGSFLRWSCS